MQFLIDLWLPIALAAVIVFIASSVLWMATPLHKGDYATPPDEADIQGAIKKHSFKPGMYFIPWCRGGHGAMKDPENVRRMNEGPWVLMMIPGGKPSFGRTLGLWFVNQVIVAALIAYVAHAAIPQGPAAPAYLKVFQIVGGVSILAHGGMAAHDTMWKGLSARHTVVKLIDAAVYAALTAGCFAGFWPRA